jgi:hypothetical protein
MNYTLQINTASRLGIEAKADVEACRAAYQLVQKELKYGKAILRKGSQPIHEYILRVDGTIYNRDC